MEKSFKAKTSISFTLNLSLLTLMRKGFFHTNQFSNSLGTNWVSYNSILTTNYLELMQTPPVKGSVPQDCSPLQTPVASPRLSPVLLTNQL